MVPGENVNSKSESGESEIPPAVGLEFPGVLDALVQEERTQRVVLAMFERRPWEGDGQQLWQLQEKLNAYASFLLDGEFEETHPQFAGMKTCIQLRTLHPPCPKALEFLEQARIQLQLMEVDLEIWEISDSPESPS